ncbi:MAG: ArnT family glycosyltransferase [Syntrophales bacterium]
MLSGVNTFFAGRHSRLFAWLLVLTLLAVFSFRVICEIQEKSVTIDETVHLPAGYYYLMTGDFDLLRIHPPFIQMLCALPLLWKDIHLRNSTSWQLTNNWVFGYDFMLSNAGEYQSIFGISRLVTLGLSVLLGLMIYVWTKELFGQMAGLFALFLFTFNPDILAHSGLVTLDIGVSFFIFATVFLLWRFIKSGRYLYCMASGITLGMAIAGKYSALLAIPAILFISLSVVTSRMNVAMKLSAKKYVLSLIVLFTISLLVINAIYFFKGSFTPLGSFHFQSGLLKPLNGTHFSSLPAPVPLDFLKGFDEQLSIQGGKFSSYLGGTVSDSSWWYYYLAAFSLKEPLAWIVLLLGALTINLLYRRMSHELMVFVLFPPLLYLVVISSMSVNIGIRYLLPAFPFLFLFSGSIMDEALLNKVTARRLIQLPVVICSLWYFFASALIHPHYLAYFNEIAGGPGRGYTFLADSNIDWGQDLIGLKEYLSHHHIDKIYLAYFGRVDPRLYGIEFDLLPGKPVKGYCAVSASYLAGIPYYLYKDMKLHSSPPYAYRWLADVQPLDTIGYSIYIYRID